MSVDMFSLCFLFFFFQAEDGIRDLVRSRGLGDVYKRQRQDRRLDLKEVLGVQHVTDRLDDRVPQHERMLHRLSLIHI